MEEQQVVLPHPADASSGRRGVQGVSLDLRWHPDGPAGPDFPLQEVAEQRGTCIIIIHKELIPRAQRCGVDQLHDGVVTLAFPAAFVCLSLVNEEIPGVAVGGICQDEQLESPACRLPLHVLLQPDARFRWHHSLGDGDVLRGMIIASTSLLQLRV